MPVYNKIDIRKAIDLERAICTSLEARSHADPAAVSALDVSTLRLEVLQQLLVQLPDDELHEELY